MMLGAALFFEHHMALYGLLWSFVIQDSKLQAEVISILHN